MARGRFISNKITLDRQVHELSSDTCRLAYTWTITFADKEGRVTGEPDLLLSQLFPRRNDITPEILEGFIGEWVSADFVIWYVGKDGDKILQLKNFEKHQIGLRKNREPKSDFDSPRDCRIIAGTLPEECPVNVNDNVNDNDKLSDQNIFIKKEEDYITAFCQITGIAYPFKVSTHAQWIQEVGEWIDLNVRREDIEAAYDLAISKKYIVARPGGLTAFLRGEIAKKNGGKSEKRVYIDQDGNEVTL